jgi:hypothetical protein
VTHCLESPWHSATPASRTPELLLACVPLVRGAPRALPAGAVAPSVHFKDFYHLPTWRVSETLNFRALPAGHDRCALCPNLCHKQGLSALQGGAADRSLLSRSQVRITVVLRTKIPGEPLRGEHLAQQKCRQSVGVIPCPSRRGALANSL